MTYLVSDVLSLHTTEIVFQMILWNRLFFFCFFVKFGGDAPILWEVDKKFQLGCGGCQHTGLQHEYHFHSPTLH